jgi:hypothetical protein
MSFECPYYNENKCRLQNGPCHPAIGKCILKGKVERAKDVEKKKNNKT